MTLESMQSKTVEAVIVHCIVKYSEFGPQESLKKSRKWVMYPATPSGINKF